MKSIVNGIFDGELIAFKFAKNLILAIFEVL